MKKFLALTVAAAMLFAFTGCWGNGNGGTAGGDMSSMGYKVGMASYTTNEKSYGYTDGKNGRGTVSTTYVTCVFDEKGTIVKAYIDEVETKLYFDQKGQLADFAGGEVRSKRELGDEYNMRPASGIGKEWYEQIDALEEYLVGKDVNTITSGINSRMMGYANYGADYSNYGYGNNYDNVDYQSTNDYANGTMYGGNARTTTNDPAPSGTMNGITGNDNSTMMDNSGDTMTSPGPSGTMNGTDGATNSGTANSGTTNSGTDGMTGDGTASWMGDLTASVTIDITNIQRAIQKAYANAK